MQRTHIVELDLTVLSYLGAAVGHTADNLVVFATGALPGERARVAIDERRRNFARGRVLEVLTAAPERVSPPCPYFGSCGGCQFQHLDYSAQVRWKSELVRRQLQRIGHFDEPLVRPTIPAPHPWSYRNQARFSVDQRGRLCFTRAQSHQLLPIDVCRIVQPAIAALIPRLHDRWPGEQHLIVRCCARTGDLLIAPRLPGLDTELPSGQESYEEVFLGRTYRVSLPSFFQVNTRVDPVARPDSRTFGEAPDQPGYPSPDVWATWGGGDSRHVSQAELLALLVLDRLALRGREFVVDAYCGVGTFAVLLARRARHVIGLEESSSAVGDARHNAEGLDNVEFRLGHTEDLLGTIVEPLDAVVLDPPRAGCAPAVLRALAAIHPSTVVYVSCDPATLARDLADLCAHGFDLVDVQPIDMFPQTHHVETVSLLHASQI